jgi:hypothetical protein
MRVSSLRFMSASLLSIALIIPAAGSFAAERNAAPGARSALDVPAPIIDPTVEGFPAPGPGVWTEGHWEHAWHGSQYGWWWVVADGWYLYPNEIHPYPPYTDTVWHVCANSRDFYPYLTLCNGDPQQMRVTPMPSATVPSAAGATQPKVQ